MSDSLIELTASQEDYLETIYHLVRQEQVARSSEISRALKVHKSSVTGALKSLAKLNLIHYAPYGHITLTEEGRLKAEDIVRRHETLMGFFNRVLGIDGHEAEEAACRMEHATSRQVVDRLLLLGEYLERSGSDGEAWVAGFQSFCGEVEAQQAAHHQHQLKGVEAKRSARPSSTRTASLRDLEAGERAALAKLNPAVPAQQRLLEAGATEGALIEVEASGPRSMQVHVRGYHLTLQSGEAEAVGIVRA